MKSCTTVPRTSGERVLDEGDLIVTKTDLAGRLTYTNDVFLKISAVTEDQALGRPHNLIRHPEMPRGIFRLLWDTLKSGEELFAYVQNLALDGASYWVFAHVTPSFGAEGASCGHHSTRRAPHRQALDEVRSIYAQMCEVETRHGGRGADQASLDWLLAQLAGRGLTYSEWLWSLTGADE